MNGTSRSGIASLFLAAISGLAIYVMVRGKSSSLSYIVDVLPSIPVDTSSIMTGTGSLSGIDYSYARKLFSFNGDAVEVDAIRPQAANDGAALTDAMYQQLLGYGLVLAEEGMFGPVSYKLEYAPTNTTTFLVFVEAANVILEAMSSVADVAEELASKMYTRSGGQ